MVGFSGTVVEQALEGQESSAVCRGTTEPVCFVWQLVLHFLHMGLRTPARSLPTSLRPTCPFIAGTNDNYRLLPLQVAQHLDVERGLQATNGKMLAVLLGCPRFDTLRAQVRRVSGVVCGWTLSGLAHAGFNASAHQPVALFTTPLQGALEVCHALLRFAVEHSVDAIIDCGALLAGTTNRWAFVGVERLNCSDCWRHR